VRAESLGVPTPPCLIEQCLPLAVAEERLVALPEALGGVGHDLVRSFAHCVEAGGDEVGEPVFVNVDAEPLRDASHLAFEIALQIRIVGGASRPWRLVGDKLSKGLLAPDSEAPGVNVGHEPYSTRRTSECLTNTEYRWNQLQPLSHRRRCYSTAMPNRC
jgi:hypothetical protein